MLYIYIYIESWFVDAYRNLCMCWPQAKITTSGWFAQHALWLPLFLWRNTPFWTCLTGVLLLEACSILSFQETWCPDNEFASTKENWTSLKQMPRVCLNVISLLFKEDRIVLNSTLHFKEVLHKLKQPCSKECFTCWKYPLNGLKGTQHAHLQWIEFVYKGGYVPDTSAEIALLRLKCQEGSCTFLSEICTNAGSPKWKTVCFNRKRSTGASVFKGDRICKMNQNELMFFTRSLNFTV